MARHAPKAWGRESAHSKVRAEEMRRVLGDTAHPTQSMKNTFFPKGNPNSFGLPTSKLGKTHTHTQINRPVDLSSLGRMLS